MDSSPAAAPGDDLDRLRAVLQWCTNHGLEAQAVIEGRHLDAFGAPTFPQAEPPSRRPLLGVPGDPAKTRLAERVVALWPVPLPGECVQNPANTPNRNRPVPTSPVATDPPHAGG